MKRKIFIGSSSEGFKYAEQIKSEINTRLGDWVECETWKDGNVFAQNKSALESLVKASRRFDYGILVASKDDITLKRFHIKNTMRDNVLFEMGLFLGSLGLQRAFLVTHDKVTLPSDYLGVTVVKYNGKNNESKIKEIIAGIERTRSSFNLKPIPAAALAFGYFQNFVIKFAEKHHDVTPNVELKILIPRNIDDVSAQIEKHAKTHPSTKMEGDRPIAFKYNDLQNVYWDIPTTLQTLDDLIDYFIPQNELGLDIEKSEWIQHELRNFQGTIEILLEKQGVYKDFVKVEYI